MSIIEKIAARPFLKWAGGKTQLLGEISARIPSSWRRERDLYVELFVGAGALFFHLRPARAVLNDANPDLMACWTVVRDKPQALIHQLGDLQARYRASPESTYYEVREWNPGDPVARAARFIMLNKTCFNGLYRVNRKGKFNVSWCYSDKATICDSANLLACSEVLRSGSITLECDDFEAISKPPKGSLVYLDPPYLPRSKTARFTSFTRAGFKEDDHIRLAQYAGKLSKAGCHVIVSQSSDEEVLAHYREMGFVCDLVPSVRKINSRGYGRGAVGDYIIH